MSVVTRIDARSKDNDSLTLVDNEGNIVATIQTQSNDTILRISTSCNVTVVKSNGKELKRK